jgi:hypothetical protein
VPTVTLVRGQDGRLAGLTDKDDRGWRRFYAKIKALGESCITFTWREPRSGPFHRFVFAQLALVFEGQDRFEDFESFLCWVKVGANHCEFLPHPERGLVAVPKSINFASLDQVEFKPISDSMFAFLRSEHARETMWPHLSESASFEMMGAILSGFQ